MRDSRACTALRSLRLPNNRARCGSEWCHLLLCQLRASRGRDRARGSSLTATLAHRRRSVKFRPVAKPTTSQWDFGELFSVEEMRRVFSVSELTTEVRRTLEKQI